MTSDDFTVAPLLDEEQINELRHMVGEQFETISAGFVHEIDDRLKQIDTLQPTLETLAAQLHSIASCAGNIGMGRLSQLSRELMKMAEENQPGVYLKIGEIRILYEKSLNKFHETVLKTH